MTGPFTSHFLHTRAQLEKALERCLRVEPVDVGAFDLFRRGLLQHIAEEEQVLLPALEQRLGASLLFREALRHDHASLATLCAPVPEREAVENLRSLFVQHAELEARDGGLYALADEVLGTEVLEALRALPQIKLTPFNGGRWVRSLLGETLRAAGVARQAPS